MDILDFEEINKETQKTVANDESVKVMSKEILTPARTSSHRESKVRDGFTITALDISSRVLKSGCVVGRCSSKKCAMPAIVRKSSSVKCMRFCFDHSITNSKKHVDLIDSRWLPFKILPEESPEILILNRDSWSFVARQAFKSLRKDYYPGSPKKPTVVFHRMLMEDSYGLARSGMAASAIWDFICGRYIVKPRKDCYKQFLQILREVVCWKTLQQFLVFDPNQNISSTDLGFGFRCPCCFGDTNSSKNIILVQI